MNRSKTEKKKEMRARDRVLREIFSFRSDSHSDLANWNLPDRP